MSTFDHDPNVYNNDYDDYGVDSSEERFPKEEEEQEEEQHHEEEYEEEPEPVEEEEEEEERYVEDASVYRRSRSDRDNDRREAATIDVKGVHYKLDVLVSKFRNFSFWIVFTNTTEHMLSYTVSRGGKMITVPSNAESILLASIDELEWMPGNRFLMYTAKFMMTVRNGSETGRCAVFFKLPFEKEEFEDMLSGFASDEGSQKKLSRDPDTRGADDPVIHSKINYTDQGAENWVDACIRIDGNY
jgi:hypothetical protein